MTKNTASASHRNFGICVLLTFNNYMNEFKNTVADVCASQEPGICLKLPIMKLE